MSLQLKLNALHFSTSLENEKGLLETSQEVLESGYIISDDRDAAWLTI
jgi:hypothetical protein